MISYKIIYLRVTHLHFMLRIVYKAVYKISCKHAYKLVYRLTIVSVGAYTYFYILAL